MSNVILAFKLSPDSPYDSDALRLFVNGRLAGEAVARKQIARAAVPLPPGPVEIEIHAAQSFAPASVLHNQDPRILAVQLTGVVQSQ